MRPLNIHPQNVPSPRICGSAALSEGGDWKGSASEGGEQLQGDWFSNEDIGRVIEESIGEPLYDGVLADIREEMLRRQRQGLGVEAATITASVWRLGNTKQARSQQIPTF